MKTETNMTPQLKAEIEDKAKKYATAPDGELVPVGYIAYIGGYTAAYESYAADREKLIDMVKMLTEDLTRHVEIKREALGIREPISTYKPINEAHFLLTTINKKDGE